MKVLVLLVLTGVALAHKEEWEVWKKWSMLKAQESCWGEENMKLVTVNLKKAMAVCQNQDAPELSLPPFRSTYRFINTMLTSAGEMDRKKFVMASKIIDTMDFNHQEDYQPMTYGSMEDKYSNSNNNMWADKVMSNRFNLKDILGSFQRNKHDHFNHHKPSGFANNYFNKEDSYSKGGYMGDKYNGYMMGDNKNENNNLEQIIRERMMEEKLKASMMKFKEEMEEEKKDMMEKLLMYGDSGIDSMNPMISNRQRLMASALINARRYKRDVVETNPGGDQTVAATLPESLDLGDRLAEKLKSEQDKISRMVGNFTCILREVNVLNQDNEIDLELQKQDLEQYQMPSQWFKERIINDLEVCHKVAVSLPEEALEEYNFPGVVNLTRVKKYLRCAKNAKRKTCMFQDMKEKLEKNFGPLDKILEQTQLTEDQLFPLVMMLLHGDEMDYY